MSILPFNFHLTFPSILEDQFAVALRNIPAMPGHQRRYICREIRKAVIPDGEPPFKSPSGKGSSRNNQWQTSSSHLRAGQKARKEQTNKDRILPSTQHRNWHQHLEKGHEVYHIKLHWPGWFFFCFLQQ
jgi:hypothetical protein